MDGVDLAEWAASHRDEVDGWFDKHGAILFRGFGLSGVEDFERVAGAIAGELFAEYGDLPPESASEKVYDSTPYPRRQDDPLPQRELASADVADAAVLLLRDPVGDRRHDAAARLAGLSTTRSIRRSARSSRRRA